VRVRIHSEFGGEKPSEIPSIHIAPVTCGSAVLGDGHLIGEIQATQHRQLKGVDMELYGMYAAVRDSTRPAPVAVKVWWSVTGTGQTGTGSVNGGQVSRTQIGSWASLYLYCYPNPNQSGSGYDYESCEGNMTGNSFNINC
jgi:hypothetical protein